jgi:hypothetical protein
MSLLVTASVRQRAKSAASINFSTRQVLAEKMVKQASMEKFDIFLSHAFNDRELILGVALTLEDLGNTVYLDWRDDAGLSRENVDPQTAEKLRLRMKQARCLFFATTDNASNSKWMPWELGFKDGQSNRSAILPIKDAVDRGFKGQEYLGIYPYVTQEKDVFGFDQMWVRRSNTCYVRFDHWLSGNEPYERE